MRPIIPHLWFDDNGQEALEFYTSIFENSGIVHQYVLENTPSGDAESFDFELAGQPFMAINGGPFFKFNPSISFMVICDGKIEADEIWKGLLEGGRILMPLEETLFASYYGWLEDKYGLSWQLMSADGNPYEQKIVPHLLFSNDAVGRAREALEFYADTFDESEILEVYEYEKGQTMQARAEISFSAIKIYNKLFHLADNGAEEATYTFNEAISFLIECESQEEIDDHWKKLSAVPEAEQCGWLKDKFGVSWQIVPKGMNELFENGTPEQIKGVTAAFLKMKKIDLAELERVWKEA